MDNLYPKRIRNVCILVNVRAFSSLLLTPFGVEIEYSHIVVFYRAQLSAQFTPSSGVAPQLIRIGMIT